MKIRFSLALQMGCVALLGLATSQALHAGPLNLVTNGGFETGDLTGWTFTPAANGSNFYVGSPANTGNYAAIFGAYTPGDYDTISQTLATQAGTLYELNFFLTDESTPSPDGAGFQVSWDGSLIFTNPGTTGFGYEEFTLYLAGGGSNALAFSGYNVDSWFGLDDVSVTATPEPGSLLLVGSGLLGMALLAWRRIRVKTASQSAFNFVASSPS